MYMVATDKLRGIISERGLSQREVAKRLGIAEKTFYSKMKKGVFGTDEAENLVRLLEIKDPASIFFAS
jgi:transcriptional regulator with XRE-family HTH domain